MKTLLTFSLLVWFAVASLAQGSFHAWLEVNAAPLTNNVPLTNWGGRGVITRIIGTNVSRYTNFVGSLDLTPYGNYGVTVQADYAWVVQGITNDWLWGRCVASGYCDNRGWWTNTEPLTMSKYQRTFSQDIWFTPLPACQTPPEPVVHGDSPTGGSEYEFPPWGHYTIDDLLNKQRGDGATPPPPSFFIKSIEGGVKGYYGLPGAGFATYQVQSSTNLTTTNWVTVTNITTGADGALNYEWPIATNTPAKYYRIRLQY